MLVLTKHISNIFFYNVFNKESEDCIGGNPNLCPVTSHPAGLCGSYNNKAEDDFMSSQKILESTAQAFANSWEMMSCSKGSPSSCVSIEAGNRHGDSSCVVYSRCWHLQT